LLNHMVAPQPREERGIAEGVIAPAGYIAVQATALDGMPVVIMFLRREVATDDAKQRIARGMMDRVEYYEAVTASARPPLPVVSLPGIRILP
jgi:hypothetical protein